MKRFAICLAMSLLPLKEGHTENISFDPHHLNMLGISQEVANHFATENRFPTGLAQVDISINDVSVGTHNARFNDEGKLCADDDFLTSLELKAAKYTGMAACPLFSDRFTQSAVTLDPGLQEVHLVIPGGQLTGSAIKGQKWAEGGTAALLNYRASSLRSLSGHQKQRWDYLNLEAGINWQNWALRHASTVSREKGKLQYERNLFYVRRILESSGQQLQLGEINLATPLIGGGPIKGMQLIPWSPLQPALSISSVEGYASSNPSRVEVFQSGRSIYATRVPAGPFILTDIPLLNQTSDITLLITGNDGGKREIQLTAAEYLNRHVTPTGWQFALGQTESTYEGKWLMSGSKALPINRQMTLVLAALAAPDYSNVAMGINLAPSLAINIDNQLAISPGGSQGQVSMHWQVPAGLLLSSSYSLSSAGYRRRDETPVGRQQQVFNEAVSWQYPSIGTLTARFNQSFIGPDSAHGLAMTWQRQLGDANLALSWMDNRSANRRNQNEQSFWLNLSLPMENKALSGFYRQDHQGNQQGVELSGDISPETQFGLTVEKDTLNRTISSGDLYSNLHFTSVSVSASNGEHSQLAGTLSGGVVAHQHGVTFSPYPVGETFAIARLEPAVSGVQIETPAGPVWSNRWGQAVVADTGSYRPGIVELNTETLPHNIDVDNGVRKTNSRFATVAQLRFKTINIRGALLEVSLADGHLLPKGSALRTPAGHFVTTVVDDGVVYVPNVNETPQLDAYWNAEGAKSCRLRWKLPEKQDYHLRFDTARAVCF